ncbi:hypothetical protein L1987_57032 [Smallanthus sonchifolius]|uniref:Uncharacterized protein n=1 Tax=Smallanthus sonchifolius TaxID=185202 RepID=A0ACB9DBW3_9ASTR|nr:hypothetical protein L1987_57032 [Smallanthus sonchifolius]
MQRVDTRHGLVHHHIAQRNIEGPMVADQVVEDLAKDEIGVNKGQSLESLKAMKNEYTIGFKLSESPNSIDKDTLEMLDDVKSSFDYKNVTERYDNFKKFDTVSEHSDHFYSKHTSSLEIERDILVRAYEGRIDLLRVVIIGPNRTPYHDGLFFFDVCFPKTYRDTPPVCNSSLDEDSVFDSLLYNQNTFFKSLKTMVSIIKEPPKHFEDFVVGHFRNRVTDILKACEAYSGGAQIGCLVEGVPLLGNKGMFAITFNDDLDSCVKPVVIELERIGAKVD